MAKISIVCPNCKGKLALMEVPGWQEKTLRCPHCRFTAKANVFRMGVVAQGRQGADDAPTQMPAAQPTRAKNEIGQLRVVASGRCFPLKEGANIIGREARTGTADLMISDDPYMSRRHLQIDVLLKPGGVEHRLVEIDSMNVVELNGDPIMRGDILRLNPGDRLLLGETEVVFELPQATEEDKTLRR